MTCLHIVSSLFYDTCKIYVARCKKNLNGNWKHTCLDNLKSTVRRTRIPLHLGLSKRITSEYIVQIHHHTYLNCILVLNSLNLVRNFRIKVYLRTRESG